MNTLIPLNTDAPATSNVYFPIKCPQCLPKLFLQLFWAGCGRGIRITTQALHHNDVSNTMRPLSIPSLLPQVSKPTFLARRQVLC